MKTVFISNYINHHQIPFSNALYERLGEDYVFIQTEAMEEKRVQMGWALDEKKIPYVLLAYEQEELCRQLIMDADLVLAGWTARTDLFLPRMEAGKLTVRISERIYREGQIKAVSPRGLAAKYQEHVRFRRQPAYLLCAGAYVASDFHLIRAYPDKMFKFGYFPELRSYDIEDLFAKKKIAAKDWDGTADCSRADAERGAANCLHFVWAGRMIPLKHPEFVTRLAKELADMGQAFHMHMAGAGPMEDALKAEVTEAGLEASFTFYGFTEPEKVRDIMEKCYIHLFTSNYLEGWGAVVNEAMNSGCCVVANAQAGAVPFLIEDGVNGMSYQDGKYENFAEKVKELVRNPESMERLGRAAYALIEKEWNAAHAAEECLRFYENWKNGEVKPPASGPFSPAPVLRANWNYNEGKLE